MIYNNFAYIFSKNSKNKKSSPHIIFYSRVVSFIRALGIIPKIPTRQNGQFIYPCYIWDTEM